MIKNYKMNNIIERLNKKFSALKVIASSNIGSRSSFVYDGVTVDRDINGARNILLRAMRDSSFQG